MGNKIICLNHYPQHIPRRCSMLDKYISSIVPLCLVSYKTLKLIFGGKLSPICETWNLLWCMKYKYAQKMKTLSSYVH